MILPEEQPRALVAYDLARKLIYHPAAGETDVSPVRSAQARLDELLGQGTISPSDHDELGLLLRTVEGCDLDACHHMDELVSEVTRTLAVWQEEFPDEVLRRLREVM